MEEYEDALKLDNMRYWLVKWTDQYNNLEPFLFKDKILKMYLSKGYRVEEVLNFLKQKADLWLGVAWILFGMRLDLQNKILESERYKHTKATKEFIE